jgi:hypothetical protein
VSTIQVVNPVGSIATTSDPRSNIRKKTCNIQKKASQHTPRIAETIDTRKHACRHNTCKLQQPHKHVENTNATEINIDYNTGVYENVTKNIDATSTDNN